jgi:hypothetical protein
MSNIDHCIPALHTRSHLCSASIFFFFGFRLLPRIVYIMFNSRLSIVLCPDIVGGNLAVGL